MYGAASDIAQGVRDQDLKAIGTGGIGLAASLMPQRKLLTAADMAIKTYQFYKTPVSVGAAGDMADVVGSTLGFTRLAGIGKLMGAGNVCVTKQDEMRLMLQASRTFAKTNLDFANLSVDGDNRLDRHIFFGERRRILAETGTKVTNLPKFNEAEVTKILADMKPGVQVVRPKMNTNIDRVATFVCPCIYWIQASAAESPVIVPKPNTCALVPKETKASMLAIVSKLSCLKADGTPNMTQQEYTDGLNFFSAGAKTFNLCPR
jgi:hypothetical protein